MADGVQKAVLSFANRQQKSFPRLVVDKVVVAEIPASFNDAKADVAERLMLAWNLASSLAIDQLRELEKSGLDSLKAQSSAQTLAENEFLIRLEVDEDTGETYDSIDDVRGDVVETLGLSGVVFTVIAPGNQYIPNARTISEPSKTASQERP